MKAEKTNNSNSAFGLFYDKITNIVLYILSLIIGISELYYLSFGVRSAMSGRIIFWTLMTVVILIMNPTDRKKLGALAIFWDIICITGASLSGLHIYLGWMRIAEAAGETTFADSVFAAIAIFIVLESTRRAIGWLLISIPVVLFIYTIFGANLPGMLAHRGYDINRVVTYLYKTTEGIFGIPTMVAATYVLIFVIFAAFLSNFGAGKIFIDLAYMMTQRRVGIVTANGEVLKERHLREAGVPEHIPISIIGLHDKPGFAGSILSDAETIDPERIEAEVVEAAEALLADYPDIGAFVFECHNLAPYAPAMSKAIPLPIFDIISFAHWVYSTIIKRKF